MPQSHRTATKKSPTEAARKNAPVATPRPPRSRSVAAPPVAVPALPVTRKAALIALLSRPEGAELAELVTATAWQVHSVRAALTHFRRAGQSVHRERDTEGVSHYYLKPA